MSNIYLKVTIEKSDADTQNFNFLSLKSLPLSQFLENSNSHRYPNCQTSCCNLKIRDLRAKLCVVFLPIILILKGTMMLGLSTNNFCTLTRF